ncbi:multisubunit Na+/H+ antiporter MnhB subunit [Rhodoblastus acidophilus]|uniref:hydrogenase subunit MbhD domain-containing protein n=1 Tax=Rhodoblastus acidophilus TaxID=1074 RepID=UPI002224518C|nr:hydrogenase subunit MbhD domain-containing protein [Rhodoblastus acidophilus]MCW2282734.1 multisubunit Na+/H+ antiporter MnhB subunit [Rhodoblastus acidophilus]MCW2331595.1 multisubunit Na+/H+ antiporter MnhB subunit [Rhodoblastus acidophilus]
MSVLAALDLGLALLVVGVAAWTVSARNLFAAVVGYVAYGLLLALVWVRLYAPDVALTEAAVGGGVTGVLLVTAGKRLDALASAEIGAPPGRGLKIFAGALAALVAGALAWVVLTLPSTPPSLAPAAAEAASGPGAGLGNPITAVLISYRSFDTMLEKVVLILAVLGVWSVGADAAWGRAPAPLRKPEPDGAMILLAQVLAPVGLLIGLHIFWVGADAPGGAFQGGALLAAMGMVAMMARLMAPPRIDSRKLRLALVAGPAVFLVVGVAGLMLAGHLFAYPQNFAKPLILFIEAFMVVSIAVALPMLVSGPPDGGAK